MMPRATLKSETNIKLPISFIVFALIAFIFAQFTFLFNSTELLSGQFRIPFIWMGAHLLLLGFAVMVAMGAMYQLVPVTFLTPIWNEKFGFVQFFITAIGITLFAISLWLHPSKAIYGGIMTIIGVLMFITQMFMTITKQKKKTTITYFVLSAIVGLLLTIIAGFILVWNISFSSIGQHTPILYSHITLGVAGWFTLLIFGFSYKLVPMFSLSHGFSMKWAKFALPFYISGLILLISSFWLKNMTFQTFGWFILLLGFVFFSLDIKEIIQKRLRRKLDKPFTFALIAIGNGLLIHLVAFFASLFTIQHPTFWGWLVYLFIMTWIMFSILGYLFKIVPFLWWTHKYSERIGKENVPTLKDMINEPLSIYLFFGFGIAIIGIIVSVSIQISELLFLFLIVLAITSFIYALSIIHVLVK